MDNIVKFKRSSVTGKLPLPSQLAYGELAVNFSADNPFLSIKNNQDQIEKFLSEKGLMSLLTQSYYDKQTINQMFEAFDPSGEVDLDLYYTKVESDSKYQPISGMTSYLTVASAENLYQPKGNYLTEHQSLENYYTKSEADGKFLTSHQDLSDYAQKSDLDDYLTITSASTIYATKEELEEHIPTVDAYTKAETDTLLQGKSDTGHTHDYEILTNKPDLSNFATKGEIPDTSGFATKQELEDYQMKSGMTSYLTIAQAEQDLQPKGTYVVPSDLNDYALKSELPSIEGLATEAELANYQPQSAMTGYSTTAHTHDYSEIENTPDLSGFASLSDIPDTSNFITSAFTEEHYQPKGNYLTEHQSLENYYTKSEADNKFLTSHQDLSNYALKSEIPDVSTFVTSAFTDATYAKKGEVPSDAYTKAETDTLLAGKANSAHTHDYETLTNKPDLSNFATRGEIPDTSGFATKQELEDYQMKSGMTSYLTIAQAEQDLQPKGDYALVSQLPDTSNFITSGYTEDHYQPKGTYVVPSDLNDYALKSEIPSTTGLASEEWVSNNFSSTAHTHSDLATKAELENYLTIVSASTTYATKSEIPDISDLATKSEIPDTSNFITSAFTDATYAKKGEVPSDAYTKAETDTLLAGKANSAHTHTMSEITDLDVPKTWRGTLAQYNNLTEIDNDTLYIITDSSEQLVTSGDVESMISGYTNLTEVQTLLEGYSTTSHTHSYNDLTDKPTIPSTTGLASETWVSNNFSTTAHTHSEYAEKTDLANYMPNSGMTDYALKSEIPNSYTKTEADNLLAGKANSAHTHTVSDITDLNIPSVEGLASEAWVSQNYQPQSGMSAYSTTAHTHSDLATKAELDDYLTIASASTIYATKEELEEFTPSDNYAGTVWTGTLSEYNNLTVIDTDTLYVITDANQQYVTSGQVESMTSGYTNLTDVQTLLEGYSTTSHTHSYNDLTDKPTIPSTTGLASETWVTNNFAGTGHTHSQYLTETSADTRYARVVSLTQAQYDALVQNDQVEQGVLYCIFEESNS